MAAQEGEREMTVKSIDSLAEFKEIIGSGKVVAINFWSEYSFLGFAPSPTFEQLAKKITGVEFYTVDVSDQIEIATWIVKTQELRSLPTFLIFRDGKKVDEFVTGDPDKLELFLQNAQTLAPDVKIAVKEICSYTQFKEIINPGRVVAIDFWAACGPCRTISPIFERLATKITGVEFYKVDVDEQEQISQEVGIRSIPTIQIFRDGKKVNELIGSDLNKLEPLLQDAQTLASGKFKPIFSNSSSSPKPFNVDVEITVKEINSYTRFKEIINSGRVVAIYFWATCGPCRVISTVFEELSRKTPGVEFYKVNVDEQEEISQEVGIRAVPTFLIFNKVDELVGAVPAKLEQLLAQAQSRA